MIIANAPDRVTAAEVVDAVLEIEQVSMRDIASDVRSAPVVNARGRMAYVLRHMTGASWPEIGRAMRRKGHSAAYACAKRAEFPLTGEAYVHCVRVLIMEARHAARRNRSEVA